MFPADLPQWLIVGIAVFMGACVGSFLNVVIYRWPRGLSVGEPKRSFCPECGTQLPFWLNLPILSWLLLRGRCYFCKAPIPARYVLVETVTMLLFLAVCLVFLPSLGWLGVAALWVFVSLLVVATGIDAEHFYIPDRINLGGLLIAFAFSALVPALHERDIWWQGLTQSLIGASCGYVLLWLVVFVGKLFFGRIEHDFREKPARLRIREGKSPEGGYDTVLINLGDQKYEWGEVFFRKWDRIEIEAEEVKLRYESEASDANGKREEIISVRQKNAALKQTGFTIFQDSLLIDGQRIQLADVSQVTVERLRYARIPREAMGYGDVKLVAMIGAFLGLESLLICLFVASISGALVGVIQKLLGEKLWGRQLPFGPYLAFGALVFLFFGEDLWRWYFTNVFQR